MKIGGVKIIEFKKNNMKYEVKWYGIEIEMIGVVGKWMWRYRKRGRGWKRKSWRKNKWMEKRSK